MQGLYFDIIWVNTGYVIGTCIRLEKQIVRELLWLACKKPCHALDLGKILACASDCPVAKKSNS